MVRYLEASYPESIGTQGQDGREKTIERRVLASRVQQVNIHSPIPLRRYRSPLPVALELK